MRDEMQFGHVPIFCDTYMDATVRTEIGEYPSSVNVKGQHENRHCVRDGKVRGRMD